MNSFDAASLALKVSCGANNELLYDNVNMPSVMVKIPKMTYAQLGLGDSNATFPAFIVNGTEVDAIWISKYQNVVHEGRAYSLPGQDPKTSINFDTALSSCKAKGAGWHLMTRMEWALLAHWCKHNGTMPYGNNNYGKDGRETVRKAIPTYVDGEGTICRVATGTGPLSWSHDGTPAGIWDLNGNVYEWVGGMRTVCGELQVLINNNAADADNPQTAASVLWKAIDATTGDFITPNGSGTTTNSLKLDYISSKWTWTGGAITDSLDNYRGHPFASVTCDASVSEAAKSVLHALAMLPYDTVAENYEGDYFYANNGNAERVFRCGGIWTSGSSAGVFCVAGSYGRSNAFGFIGFRSAYVELPAE